jgi:hypothetical protein
MKYEKQQMIAVQMASGMAQMLHVTQAMFPEPGEKETLFMSASMIGISALAAITAKSVGHGNQYIPTQDHILFASLMTANAVEFDRDGELKVEFDIANVIKAMDQFKEMTGRSFDELMNDSLLGSVNAERNKALSSVSNSLSKFMPN